MITLKYYPSQFSYTYYNYPTLTDTFRILFHHPFFLVPIFIFLSPSLQSQCTNGTQPECKCSTAPVLCTIDELDGYSFSMAAYQHPNDGPTPICSGANMTQTNNPTWFAFTAWCTNLSLRVHSTNCHQSGGAIGFQLAIYTNCSFNHLVACNADVDDCNTNDKILNLTGLNIGAVYYFMVDGCLGSYCTVTIDIIGVCGQEHIAPWTMPVTGNLDPCTGDSEIYTVEDLDGARIYHWFLDGVPIGQTSTESFNIAWTTPGTYQLCIDASNDPCVDISDPPSPLCTTIVVHEADAGILNVTPATLCAGEQVQISTTGFSVDPSNTQMILVTDLNGIIIEVINGSTGSYTAFLANGFNVYSYNFVTNGGIIPMAGDNISGINCATSCCDLESQTFLYPQLNAVVSDILCDDNGTGSDSTDDIFTFDVLLTGLTTGTLWRSTDGTLQGMYGTKLTCGPYLISGGPLSFDLHDYDTPACWTSIFVDPPYACSSCVHSVDAGPGILLNCINTKATLTGISSDTGAYHWTGPKLFSSDSLICVASDSGWYYLSIDFGNQCNATDSVFVDLDTDAPVANAGEDQWIDCTHSEVLLDGSGSTGDQPGFLWMNTAGNIISTQTFVLVNTTGIYTLQLTNTTNGCSSMDTAEVLINQNELGDISIIVLPENCAGEKNGLIEVTGISKGMPPYVYTLGAATSDSIGNFGHLSPGEYNLHITDANGCSIDTSITINPGIHLEITLPEIIRFNEDQTGIVNASVNVPESDLSSVQWSPAGTVSCDTCLSTMITTKDNQTIQLIVIHRNGCIAKADLEVIVLPTPDIYIPNTFSPNGDGFNDLFTLYSNDGVASILEMNIFDRWGEHLYQAKNISPNSPEYGWDGKFHHKDMPSATFVYYFKLLLADGAEKTVTGDVTLVR